MMPVNHVQSRACHVTVWANVGSCLWSGSTGASTSNMTAVDLMATGVTVNKHLLKVTYSPFKLFFLFFTFILLFLE